MKKISWILAITLPVAFVACQKDAVQNESSDVTVNTAGLKSSPLTNVVAGNDAPSGAHYNLNIIGVKEKSAPMDGNSSGHVIFMPLWGNAKISLTEGEFDVLDANGTDANGAKFQLPNPDPEADGTTTYRVYARALGKPATSVKITTCAEQAQLADGSYEYVALDCGSITLNRSTDGKFVNVTKDLLYVNILADTELSDGSILKAGRYPLFDDRLEGYYWEYDNSGLKLLQLRFYQIPDVVEGVVPKATN